MIRPVIALAVVLLVAGLSPAAGHTAAKIYRTVDENGNVVFTDVPPKEGETGEAVDLGHSNSFTPPRPQSPSPSPAVENESDRSGRTVEEWLRGEDPDEDAQERTADASGYQSLRVASPANDAAVRNNAGNVTITAAVEPRLRSTHVMELYLDGALRERGRTTSFQLVNVDRGTHNVAFRIVDQAGNVLASSEPSVFHLQRRSVLLQPGNRGSN